MSESKHSSLEFSISSESIYWVPIEEIKIDYKVRIYQTFNFGEVLVENGNDMSFFLTPNIDGLSISNFMLSFDILIGGVQQNPDSLIKKTGTR